MNTTAHIESLSPGKFSDKQKRNLIVILVALFPLLFSAFIFALVVLIGNIHFPEKIGAKSKFGEIIMPANKSVIPKKFAISGTIEDMPDNTYVYLVEKREGLFWPKLAIGNKAKTWNKQLTAHGKKNKFFSFLLVTVDKKGKQKFDGWFKTSRVTGKYPGLKDINFSKPIAKIRVKTK